MSPRPDQTSSSLSPSQSRKGSFRNHFSKLKSWFKNIASRASKSHPPPTSRPLPGTQTTFQLLTSFPPEIRRQIYVHVLNSFGTVQHVFLSDSKLTHMHCASPISHELFQSWNVRYSMCETSDIAYRRSVQNGWEIIPLLLSCKQIYQDLIEMIYSSTTTFCLTVEAATQFIDTVPASCIALAHLELSVRNRDPMLMPYIPGASEITSASLNFETKWENFWQNFAHRRVRALFVEILGPGMILSEQALLEPLKNVVATELEVALPWPTGLKTNGDFEGAGFVVRRPPERLEEENGPREIRIDVDSQCSWFPQQPRPFWKRFRRRGC